MTGIIGTLIPGGIWPMVIGGVAIAAVSATGATVLTHKLDAPALAQSQTETANAKAALSAYEAAVAAKTAAADAAALDQQTTLQNRLNAIQAQLAISQKAENAKSDRLKAILNKAAPGDIKPIGPVAGAYYAGLHQSAPSPAPASPGNP